MSTSFPWLSYTYWCADCEFSKSYDDELWDEDELWLSAVSWAIVGNLLPTGVKSNCHLYHLRRLLFLLFQRLSSCLRSEAMPPSVGILRSGSAGLKPSCCQLRRSWPVMQLVLHHWNKFLRDWYQYSKSTQSTLYRRHRMSLATSHHRVIDRDLLNSLTGADFLQLGHTALTRTVRLKPHMMTLHKWFRLEFVTVVSDIARSSNALRSHAWRVFRPY